VLVDAGYVVTTATDGDDALQVVAAAGGPPDLVVTDVVMPRLGGREMAASLIADWPDLPVLFVSGYVEDLRRAEMAVDRELTRFLAKPFGPSQLLDAVRELLALAYSPVDGSNR
jgi:two-component system, cell cycle sensor histidine kinase and response regulator CckA